MTEIDEAFELSELAEKQKHDEKIKELEKITTIIEKAREYAKNIFMQRLLNYEHCQEEDVSKAFIDGYHFRDDECKFLKECADSATEVYNSNMSYLYETECEAVAILKGLQDFIYTTDSRRADELAFLQNRIEMFLEEHKV